LVDKENDNNHSQDIDDKDKDKDKDNVKTLPKGNRFKENVEPLPADADNEDMV
jgi:hypothetical protein